MKFRLIYLITFLLVVFLFSQAQAAEVYCSLNDGRKADGKTVFEHGGTKHEFCCSGCLDKFKADPKNFAQQDAAAACSSVCSG